MTTLTTAGTAGATVAASAGLAGVAAATESWWDLADRRRETGQPRDPRQNRTSAAPQARSV